MKSKLSTKQAWLWYSLLRIVFFAVPFALLMLLVPGSLRQGITFKVLFSVICAALISLALSVLFLSKLRQQATAGLRERSGKQQRERKTVDAEFEDAVLDSSESQGVEGTRGAQSSQSTQDTQTTQGRQGSQGAQGNESQRAN